LKAAVLKGPNSLEVKDVPEPQPGSDEVKVKIAYCGVCGTDPEIIEGRFIPPEWTESTVKIPGHESSGIVVAVGDQVRRFKVGQRVACNFRSPCGACHYCRSGMENFCEAPIPTAGGFAEYCVYKESAVYALPANMGLDIGAFLEPVSIAVHVVDIAGLYPGASVAVLGGGPIGLLSLQIAVRAGAVKTLLSEPVVEKRDLARKLGADLTVDPLHEDLAAAARRMTDGHGFRSVIDASGRPTVAKQAVSLADKGGTIVWAAVYPSEARIEVPPFYMYQNELSIRSVFLSPYCFPRALDLLSVLDIKSLITDVMPLSEIGRAFEMHKQGRSVKILVKM
jgi:(R,R)-butanediol dehydrogenase/meso-butanediol dehydrogenase/diacetyl reductase/L-iditol 2-dehydrogenase